MLLPNAYNDVFKIKDKYGISLFAIKKFPNPRLLEAIEALSKLRGTTIEMKNDD